MLQFIVGLIVLGGVLNLFRFKKLATLALAIAVLLVVGWLFFLVTGFVFGNLFYILLVVAVVVIAVLVAQRVRR